ncbi:hypothetical protein B0H34DRAFT_770363 [Crassisporium funariophilum]|nr:hypothetical protein B0H34DRAFT_770363 [Crassisporium funariophilum]
MALPKGVPTLQHMRSKRYSHPDNVFSMSGIMESITRCKVNPGARPIKTNHFTIITIIDLPHKCTTPPPAYNFRATDWEDFYQNLEIQLQDIPKPKALPTEDTLIRVVDNLTATLQDTIRTRVPLQRQCPKSKRWWTSDLKESRKRINKMSAKSYTYRAM